MAAPPPSKPACITFLRYERSKSNCLPESRSCRGSVCTEPGRRDGTAKRHAESREIEPKRENSGCRCIQRRSQWRQGSNRLISTQIGLDPTQSEIRSPFELTN